MTLLQKLDWELLPEYYAGKNEPVGIWIQRNFKTLFLFGHKVTREKEMIEDAIQDVANKLCSWEKIIRPEKFKPANNDVRGALWIRLKNRLIDLVRANKKRKELIDVVGTTEDVFEEKNLDQEIIESRMGQLKKIQQELPADEQRFLDLMLKYGFGKLKPIMDELNLTQEEARKMKQRIVRKIKRSLLTDSKNSKNG